MAGFLKEAALPAIARKWASSPCAPYPCGEEVWAYACEVEGIAPPPLPEHRTRRAVSRLLREKGGLVAYASELMAKLGWEAVERPGRGDVGVADIPGMGLTCAICLDNGEDLPLWMAKGDHRVLTVRAPFRRAWGPSCPRR
ncbi:hypothetical protein SAMN02927924_01705 [Sphingobium faniae]|nr:hypothetical protein SAMN02927924_01705 [Sphingobium faniae]